MSNESQKFSKDLFGSKHRLVILSAIAERSIDPPEPFYAKQIADEHDIPSGMVNIDLVRFERHEMVARATSEICGFAIDYSTYWYVRTPHPVWEAIDFSRLREA